MSLFTVIAFVLLPLLGGFIAWAGDVIGYRLGKTRRSLFGLRPRTTARLVGVLVGVLLPLLTMALAALGSSYVRTALFELSQLQHSRDALLESNAGLATQNGRLLEEIRLTQEAEQVARAQVADASERLRETERRLSLATASLARSRTQLTQVQAERTRLVAQAGQLRTQLDQLRAQLDQLQATRAALQTELDRAQDSLRDTQSQLTQTQSSLTSVEAALAQSNRRVEDLQTEETGLRQEVMQLQANARRYSEDARNARQELNAIQQELQVKQDQVARQQQQLLVYTRMLQATAGEVRYEPGAELIRAAVSTTQTTAQIEASLQELLVLASKVAAAKGAGQAASGLTVVAVAPVPEGATSFPPREDLVLRSVAEEVSRMTTASCVVATRVALRSFVDDGLPVAVELWAKPNVRVFEKGQVIVAQEVDGSRPRAEVFQQILGLLGALRQAAQQAGLLRDVETGQYGQVPAEQILEVLDRLVSSQVKLRVEAVAAEDVYVASDKPFVVLLQAVGPEEAAPAGERGG